MISERMPLRDILDVLVATRKLLNWDRVFGPLSGLRAKIEDPASAYVVTAFCYGCNLGPAQTARSLPVLDRKPIAWINQRHITEENLQKAIEIIVNAYNKFTLPAYWGDTSSVSADGTKWDLYENNLLSEYHVRHGGYGGIGCYHVSDNYIALFSRFIPCGVYEAVYILDPFFENKSEVQPDTIHADTHGQSLTVFGLAFLLGIQLMPRIAKWEHLKIFKPFSENYRHIEAIFSQERIDWDLIEKHLDDMLRIVLSIHEGRVAPSTILRRLGTHSRKNKLYFAFQELDKAVRSAYLLRYIRDPDLRRKVNHATTVSEAFNDFIQFVAFGNKGIIAENTRDQQRKIIRYGHLVVNALIFMNVYDQSVIMSDLVQEVHVITPEVAEATNPYRKGHLNRFGTYSLNETRLCPAIDYDLQVVSSPCP
jgi:TnpA family transposase